MNETEEPSTSSFVVVPALEYHRLCAADDYRRDHIPVILAVAGLCFVLSVVAAYFWWRAKTAETLLLWRKNAARREISQ